MGLLVYIHPTWAIDVDSPLAIPTYQHRPGILVNIINQPPKFSSQDLHYWSTQQISRPKILANTCAIGLHSKFAIPTYQPTPGLTVYTENQPFEHIKQDLGYWFTQSISNPHILVKTWSIGLHSKSAIPTFQPSPFAIGLHSKSAIPTYKKPQEKVLGNWSTLNQPLPPSTTNLGY